MKKQVKTVIIISQELEGTSTLTSVDIIGDELTTSGKEKLANLALKGMQISQLYL